MLEKTSLLNVAIYINHKFMPKHSTVLAFELKLIYLGATID